MNETEQCHGGGAGQRQPRDRGEAHRHWDPLRDDCTDYAARLTAAGVAAQVRHEPLLVHAYLRARHMSPAAAASFAAITEAARSLGHSGRLPAAETVVA